jgi:hypothetical protein
MSHSRPLLTFDLDGVLCRPPLGINPGRNVGKARKSEGAKGLLWRTERMRYTGRRPMAGAREGFALLSETYDCQVLSARGEHARELTEAWLKRWIGVVPPVHLRPSWEESSAGFKVRKVQELGVFAHFEDDPHTAVWVAEHVKAVFLVDWWRNRWLTADGVFRVRSLAEAAPTLAGLVAAESG